MGNTKLLAQSRAHGSKHSDLLSIWSKDGDAVSILLSHYDLSPLVECQTSEGQFLRSFGTAGKDQDNLVIYSYGIAVDRDGLVYVSDTTHTIF